MPTRRHVLALSGSAALIAVARGATGAVPTTQVAGIYRRGVGDRVVTAFLDGSIPLDLALLSGADEETKRRLLEAAFAEWGPYPASINAYVIQSPDRTILVDGGLPGAVAPAFGANAGHLPALLAEAGVEAAEVDTIFATHLHPDHIGAFATADGAATFPNAELALHEAERAFWTDDANFAGADEGTRAFVQAARGAIAPYAERLRPLTDGAEVAPGVTLQHLPGHTPGHSGLMVSDGDESVLIWADIVHVGPVQFARPDVSIAFDVDPEQAAATRKRIMDRAATDRLEIAGSHVVFPSFGHVLREGDGYRFAPSRWDYSL